MKYVDIFRTSDRNELAIIKNLFDEENIAYQTQGEAMDSAANIGGMGNYGLRIAVEENQQQKAVEIIKRSGFIEQPLETGKPNAKKPQIGKGMLFVLAALVVLVAIVLFVWFMNG
jgi:hypothetical protein